jgi:hypothetical protein
LWNASDAVGLHQSARDWPAAAVLGCALAGMLTRWRTRLALGGSVMLLIASTGMAFVGSTAFLDRFGVDAFLGPAASVTVKSIDGSPLTQFPIPFIPTEVRLSRTGRYVAVASEDDDERTSFHVGRAGGPLATVDADSVVFIGDDRVLALKHDRAGATVSELAPDSPGTVVWQRQLTHVASAKLSVDVGHGEWRLLGLNHDHQIVRMAGDMDGRALSERNWLVPDGTEEWADPIATAGDRVMIAATRYERDVVTTGPWRRLLMAFPPVPRSRTRLRILGPSGVDDVGVTHFNPTCDAALLDPGQVVCAAFDGSRTAIFRLDSSLRRLTPIASMAGRFYPQRHRSAGWITGWGQGGGVALRLDSREAFRVVLPEGGRSPQIDVSERVLGALAYGDGVATMRLYSLD